MDCFIAPLIGAVRLDALFRAQGHRANSVQYWARMLTIDAKFNNQLTWNASTTINKEPLLALCWWYCLPLTRWNVPDKINNPLRRINIHPHLNSQGFLQLRVPVRQLSPNPHTRTTRVVFPPAITHQVTPRCHHPAMYTTGVNEIRTKPATNANRRLLLHARCHACFSMLNCHFETRRRMTVFSGRRVHLAYCRALVERSQPLQRNPPRRSVLRGTRFDENVASSRCIRFSSRSVAMNTRVLSTNDTRSWYEWYTISIDGSTILIGYVSLRLFPGAGHSGRRYVCCYSPDKSVSDSI